MGVNISGRSFLKLLDFSTQEIEYLLALSRNLKDLKRTGTPHRYLEGKTSSCSSKRPPRAPVVPLRWAPWTWAWA